MLRYLNRGVREFGLWPIHAYKRPNWEFYVVIKGKCGLLLDERPKPRGKSAGMLPLRQSHLWVFPPQHYHGWYGAPDSSCEILVFHFNPVPALLERAIEGRGYLETSLTEAQCRRLKRLARMLTSDYEHPTGLGSLRAERALIDLSLVALDRAELDDASGAEPGGSAKVEAALAWFAKHLRERPSLERVAEAVHVSATHLRRLFAQWHGKSPHRALMEIQLAEAARLLTESDAKLTSIAAECGFSTASNLCRAFKSFYGFSPNRWRRKPPSYDQAHRQFLKAAFLSGGPKGRPGSR